MKGVEEGGLRTSTFAKGSTERNGGDEREKNRKMREAEGR